jgi:hypothetical protein
MWLRVTPVRTDISEERIASIIRLTRIGGFDTVLLVTAKAVPSSLIRFTLMMEPKHSSEMSVLTRTTRRHIPEDGIVQELIR